MKDKRRNKNVPNGMEISTTETKSKKQKGQNEINMHYNTETNSKDTDNDLDEIDQLCEEMEVFCNYVDDNYKKEEELRDYRWKQNWKLIFFNDHTKEEIKRIKKKYADKIKEISDKYNKKKYYMRSHLFEKEKKSLSKSKCYNAEAMDELDAKIENVINETDYKFEKIKKKIINKKINEIEEYKKQREEEKKDLEQNQLNDYENYKTNYNENIKEKYKMYGNKMNEYEEATCNKKRKKVKIEDPYPYTKYDDDDELSEIEPYFPPELMKMSYYKKFN